MEEALVNYFEIGSCLDDITRQQLVTLTKAATPSPRRAAKWRRSLPTTCPAVCGSALWPLCCAARHGPQGSQVQCQHYRKEDGHCTIRCTVKGLDSELFCLDLGTPDR